MGKKGISLNSVEKSLSHSADKIRRRTLLCFERILVSKIFKQRRGEASRFCRKFFNLTGPKKLRQGTILCFRKFLVGKNILWIRGGGAITSFRRSFCLTVPKYFIAEHFGVSENFFYRKFSCIGGGASWFCRNFLSHRTETESFVKEPFCFPEVYWYRKMLDKRGGEYHNFPSKFFCPTVPKNFLGESFSVSLISGIEKLWIRGGRKYRDFPSKIFCLTVPKNFVDELFCAVFQKIYGRE